MNAIELVIIACSLLANNGKCKEHSLVFADVTLLTCMTSGQPTVAQWSEQHPNHSIKRWLCRPAGQFAKL